MTNFVSGFVLKRLGSNPHFGPAIGRTLHPKTLPKLYLFFTDLRPGKTLPKLY